MITTCRSISRVGMISLALAMMLVQAVSSPAQAPAGGQGNPVIQDWTTHHVVFSDPGSKSDAIRAGKYEQWLRIVSDPRYIMQQQRRSVGASGPTTMKSRLTEPALRAIAESDASIAASGATAAALEMTLEEREASRGGNRKLPSGLSRALIPPSGRRLRPASFQQTSVLGHQRIA